MSDQAGALRVEKHCRDPQEPSAADSGRNRTGLLKYALRADLLICFMVIPIGILIGSLWGISPTTISLIGLTAIFVISCMRALRKLG
jgi:hypothetical protein